ncbi:MAG: Hpt domain-containing protein, partial [Pseudomonadota bacterium]
MDDLISEFIAETSESIQLLDSELVKLEQNPNDEKILGNIFRLVHTIKGTCGFLGLPRLEAVAHASENVLGKIRDKIIVVTPTAISFVLESLDCIKAIVEYLGTKGEEPAGNDLPLIAKLNAFADSNGEVANGEIAHSDTSGVSAQAEEIAAPVEAPVVQEQVQPVAPSEEVKPKEVAKEVVAAASHPATETKDHDSGQNSANQSIRVNIDVLENLMQMVGELVLTRNQLLQIVRTRNDPVFATPLQHLSHITSELQEGIMKTRMQPISNAWSKFPRLIRDLSLELGKKIDLRMIGAETELDRQLLEMIKDPLTHMVRNSADHGLETPADRKASGKSETGT